MEKVEKGKEGDVGGKVEVKKGKNKNTGSK